jgi:Zn-dependent peptidase ImmA (M78 family)
MNPNNPKLLMKIFRTRAPTAPEAALQSKRKFVRGRSELSPYDGERQHWGREISAYEALAAYGIDVLDEAVEYGSAVLLSRPNAVGKALRSQRDAIGIDIATVAQSVGVSVQDLQRIESGDADDIHIGTMERIAFTLGLDEAMLAFQADAAVGGDVAARLKTLRSGGFIGLSQRAAAALTEAASVIRVHHTLQEQIGASDAVSVRSQFTTTDNYGNRNTPAWRVGYGLAEHTRDALYIPAEAPIRSMRELVEHTLGIPVVRTELPPSIAGATIAARVNNGHKTARGIVLNTSGPNSNPLVCRATLAHEIGHLLFDPEMQLENVRVDHYEGLEHNPEGTHVDYVEQRANAFAISFLAPGDAVRDLVHGPFDSNDIMKVVSRFGISVTAARFHVNNAYSKQFSEPHVQNISIDTRPWRAVEDFDTDYFPIATTPISRRGKFAGLVVHACRSKLVSTDTAAYYLHCSPSELQKATQNIMEMHVTP